LENNSFQDGFTLRRKPAIGQWVPLIVGNPDVCFRGVVTNGRKGRHEALCSRLQESDTVRQSMQTAVASHFGGDLKVACTNEA